VAKWVPDVAWDDEDQTALGLAGMFAAPAAQPVFHNFVDDVTPNIGLLDNSVIPMLNNILVSTNPPKQETPAYVEEPNDYGTTVILNDYTSEQNDDGQTVIIGEE
jgi:hypothetical protein